MRSISLSSKVTRIVLATQAYAKLIKSNVLTKLSQQTHTLGIMNLHILYGSVYVVREEDARRRTIPAAKSHHSARHQSLVFPLRSQDTAWSNLFHTLYRTIDIACIIHQMLGIALESDAIVMTHGPSLAEGLKELIFGDAILHPRCRLKHDTLLRVVLNNLNLRDMRILEIDMQIFQRTVLRSQERNRQHTSVEYQLSPLPVYGKVFHIL